MWSIIILIVLGMLLLMAEFVLLPGLSIAGIGSLLSYAAAAYLGFAHHSTAFGFIVIGVAIASAAAIIVISLKGKTWQRFALKANIDGKSQEMPAEKNVKIGAHGVTVTRLAPMGKVLIGNETYEAKSMDEYVDQKTDVEVVGFENFNIVVKSINK